MTKVLTFRGNDYTPQNTLKKLVEDTVGKGIEAMVNSKFTEKTIDKKINNKVEEAFKRLQIEKLNENPYLELGDRRTSSLLKILNTYTFGSNHSVSDVYASVADTLPKTIHSITEDEIDSILSSNDRMISLTRDFLYNLTNQYVTENDIKNTKFMTDVLNTLKAA
ncbi:MAG: hypothetical protein HRT47_00175 [Candidatus Caenarcaniphilales bacterium]|nr:hypothetical protein [Candidatus Caenarcaniphilales bacterium]